MNHECTASMLLFSVLQVAGMLQPTWPMLLAWQRHKWVHKRGPYEQVSCWMCMLQGLHAGLQLTIEHHVNTAGQGQAAGVQRGAVSVLGDGSYCQTRQARKVLQLVRIICWAPQPLVCSLLWCQDTISATAALAMPSMRKLTCSLLMPGGPLSALTCTWSH